MNSETSVPQASQDTASLVKRLAGPSTNKAGLAKDQTEINRIIADASKGSKFYENERKKDKDLTARITRILKHRDEVLKNVDTHKIESSVDIILAGLESQRDLSQIIVHVDMDAFFANVELLYNPELEGKPFGVGHGVLTTASYEARKYGVRSGMPGFIAKKLCPDLTFVKINGSRYNEMSKKVFSVFKRYDQNMCPAGCDEGYLNITAYCNEHGLSTDLCVQEMRRKVQEETKLTVSAGIAPTKMLAKICSDKNKPNGQFHLPFNREAIISFLHDLSIRKIPGIGRVNERLLESVGIKTCGDIYAHRAMLYLMDKQFGLQFLLRTHLGITSNVVQPMKREERKSIGAERTFNSLGDKDRILQKLEEVASELENDMKRNGWTGRTVTLKFKLDTYQVFTRAKSFDRWITRKEDLYATGKELLLPELPLKIRLIGLRVTKLKDLQTSSSSEIGGIKRFFEPLETGSPSKKRQLEHDNDHSGTEIFPQPDQDDEEYDEAMPGFHEHDEGDVNLSLEDSEVAKPELEGHHYMGEGRSRPRPVSVSAPQNNGVASTSVFHAAPHSTSTVTSNPFSAQKPLSTQGFDGAPEIISSVPTAETHSCPVCGKTLQTDNTGLNTHIDFCLSRGAIRDAQTDTGGLIKPAGLQWGADKGKVTSARKRKKV